MEKMIKVLLVDDHALVRAGFKYLFNSQPDIRIIGEAADGLEGVEKALEMRPDVILMDIFMPRCTGLEAMLKIKEKLPDIRILIVTISDKERDLFEALRMGAQGYLLKGASTGEVVDAVRKVAAGEVTLSPEVVATLVNEFRNNNKSEVEQLGLSDREKTILEMVGRGMTNHEMAEQLFLSESTVRTYIRRVLDKLQLKNRAAAIAYAVNHHI